MELETGNVELQTGVKKAETIIVVQGTEAKVLWPGLRGTAPVDAPLW